MDDILEHRDHTGQIRKLGLKPPSTPMHQFMRSALTNILDLREEAGLPRFVPEAERVEVDYISPWGAKVITNQHDSSGCTGWSGCQALSRELLICGYEWPGPLSGACLYAWINGGHDQGSVIIEALEALQRNGVCLAADMDYPNIWENQIPKNKLRFFEGRRVICDTYEEVCTALWMKMIPQFPVTVGRNFERFSGDGVAGFDDSDWGNHSVHAGALIKMGGEWRPVMPNTWGMWGPFVKSKPEWAGCCILTKKHIDSVAHTGQSFAHVDCYDKLTLSTDAPTPR